MFPFVSSDAIDLGAGSTPAFQPLARIDQATERSIALDWVMGLLAQEDAVASPELKEKVWAALTSLASAPISQRHLTGLRLLVQDAHAQAALLPYCQEGAHGAIFDGAEDRLEFADILTFEMEEIMGRPKAAAPALVHLFHRLEERFDGRPTLLILDEAWVFLDSPIFAARIREWLKTLRKKNVAVVFATQSLADIANSSIAPALIESCPTRIYLPNERAFEPQQRVAYEQFGLNETEIELIATAQRKRDYYYASPLGRRVFDLALGPVALAFCAASDPASRAFIADLEKQNTHRTKYWKSILAARRLDWVLEALGEDFRDDLVAVSVIQGELGDENMIAITLMLGGAMFGFAYGVLSYALPFAPDMDVFTSTGIGFGLGAGASFVVIALQLSLALGRFAFAILTLFAPLASWIVALITDPLGTNARIRDRARIDAIYPPPDLRERRFYAET